MVFDITHSITHTSHLSKRRGKFQKLNIIYIRILDTWVETRDGQTGPRPADWDGSLQFGTNTGQVQKLQIKHEVGRASSKYWGKRGPRPGPFIPYNDYPLLSIRLLPSLPYSYT